MLSFELSAIDIVLTVAVIILFVLNLPRSSKGSKDRTRPSLDRNNLRKDGAQVARTLEQSEKADASKCLHSFGYLGNLPTDASVPNECLACPRVMECSSRSE